MPSFNLIIYWCPECDCTFEQEDDDHHLGFCPDCDSEGEFIEEVDDLEAA